MAGLVMARASYPGRQTTAIGMIRAISRQRCHRSNCARLSAPISQTKRRLGYRRRSARSVSRVYLVPSRLSIAVTRIGARRAMPRAEATRAASGAIPVRGFSGFPGETSHHAPSSASARNANSVMRRCAPCAGLKLPPSSAVAWPNVLRAEMLRAEMLRAASGRCRAPATCTSSALRARRAPARAAGRWRCRSPRLGRTRRHRRTGSRRSP